MKSKNCRSIFRGVLTFFSFIINFIGPWEMSLFAPRFIVFGWLVVVCRIEVVADGYGWMDQSLAWIQLATAVRACMRLDCTVLTSRGALRSTNRREDATCNYSSVLASQEQYLFEGDDLWRSRRPLNAHGREQSSIESFASSRQWSWISIELNEPWLE